MSLAGLVLVAGCGREAPAGAGRALNTEPAAGVELTARSTVLEDESHGPELCLGGVADSYPPQCGGVPVVGWVWDREPELGTRWGEYVVVGTYDGRRFTVTRPPVPAEDAVEPPSPSPDDTDLSSTPCPEPEGGWRVIDRAKTTGDSLHWAIRRAEQLPGYTGVWLDRSGDPKVETTGPDNSEDTPLEPWWVVLNVAVTGNTVAAESEVREAWGGALCVSKGELTHRELARIQREVSNHPDHLASYVDATWVSLQVTYDDGALQQRYDEKYGPGVVKVTSALTPYDP